MTSTAQEIRVAVVGGGILGVSTAYRLARRGAAVTLVSDGALAGGASGRSLAWLNSAAVRSPEYHRLRVLGIDRYRTLAAREPGLDWLRFDGGLAWGTAEQEADFRERLAHQRANGYEADWLSPAEIAGVTPGVNPAAVPGCGAIFNPGEGWVDLPPLIELLAEELTGLGGEVVTEAGPATVRTAGGRVTGVTTRSGLSWDGDAVVLATGASTPAMLSRLGVSLGDRTPISLLVRTERVNAPLRAVLNTPRVSIRPTPDGALVLDSGWSEEEIVRHEDGTFEVRQSTVAGLLAEASAVLAGTPRLPLQSYAAGPKPIPADGEPVFGRLEEIAGCHVAFTHSGATLGLIAGELLADEIVTGRPHPLLSAFRPGRFRR
ncbi:NAD(P)/FAD-dependent oxidoreductase [Streptomyces iranensis]|uniref:Glycine/D-amino acid oxidase-like deaminating enzyme n=1 Tax=Streptomyces iranensis TaxID=576784 RepID=A0A061A585_9ACTN|nr:FAD-binding oxidoreductase [Streptomyces iranensis]MBP2067693.1 glycine/D-amino acid oxidase-like deaminating enzyme [Streptomyces iranensis]CDR17998.1 sarcosine oxidase, beta subunit family [Streptomyces iranensis]